MKRCLITGITGQDSSYLAEFLLEMGGYEVVGMDRRKSVENGRNIAHIRDKIKVVVGDITDPASVNALVAQRFDEIYNLAAQSFVGTSFDQPYYTFQANAVAVLHFLEAIRTHSPETRFYQASTSEMMGGLNCPPTGYNEDSPFYPRSPYGVSKLAAFWLVKNYRESYGLKCCNGILFNHESPRRGHEFVTQKICTWVKNMRRWMAAETEYSGDVQKRQAAVFKVSLQGNAEGVLRLGNIDTSRDWGHAKDFARGIWLILNQKDPLQDLVLGTGETHSVREFIELAVRMGLGREIVWDVGLHGLPYGLDKQTGLLMIECVREFYRPSEVDVLKANYSRARELLGWRPEISFQELVKDMLG